MTLTPEQFGVSLRERRTALRYSLARLATEAGLAVITLRRLEAGAIARPYRHTLESLAAALYETSHERRRLVETGLRLDPAGGAAPAVAAPPPLPEVVHTQIVAPPIMLVPLSAPPLGVEHLLISAVFRLERLHGALYRYDATLPLLHERLHWGEKSAPDRVECALWLDGEEQCRLVFSPYDRLQTGHFTVAGLAAELIVERLPSRHVAMRQRLLVGGVTIFER